MVVAVLDRNVQILDNLRFRGDGVDEFIVDLIGIDVMQPDPMQILDPAQFLQQGTEEPLAAGQIRAVAASILGHHDHLFHALMSKNSCLIQHVVQLPGTKFAPQRRDHTVGAFVVAALSDL